VTWTKGEDDLRKLTALQTRLLDKAASLLKPGGRLVYCTCSLEADEGENQAEAFLSRHPDFVREPISPAEIGGAEDWITRKGDLRTLPFHLDGAPPYRGGVDGFFAARFVRGLS
jgi:16S rRNA (cytosine967-C5)-methyltransferase